MSAYGEDYSDEERNFIEHGGASQGESDIEGESVVEGEGGGVGSILGHGASGIGGPGGVEVEGEGVNREPSAAARGNDGSGAVERPDSDSLVVSQGESARVNIAVARTTQSWSAGSQREMVDGANNFGLASHQTWDNRRNHVVGWGNAVDWCSAGNHSGSKVEADEANLSKPTWKKAELLPTKARPMRSLTAQEFCERLKLFESQRVAVLVSPKEVLFSIPKDLLCANSTFFDRAFNGKFKESVELTMHLPEDTVLAFQMLLQWVYTGNIIIDTNGGATEKIGIYLDFFKLADKIDLLGPLDLITGNFKQHLCHTRLLLERQSNCGQECATNGNQADAICSCRRDSSWIATGRHAITCDIVQANCVSKEAHIDLLRDGVITSEHIQSAFELLPDHVARQTLVRACVAPYIMSCTMSYKFKFSKELETVEDYCQSLLKEVALTRTLNNVFTDPLTKSALKSWVRKGDDRWVEVPMSL